ncbi:MAG: helix-turn-helix transcriptional regulator [Dermatophilaceae bacterium]|nr:helix-turn-helix transcriptional regulator [Dermatophilaceae bacterium]
MEHPLTLRRQVASSVAAAARGAGRSVRDISEATGIPLSTLSRCLNGHAPFTVDHLGRLSDVLGVTVEVLVSNESHSPGSDTSIGSQVSA